MKTATQDWFGDDFASLNPLLQQLHTNGGILAGAVTITTGRGIGGILGRRMARKMNIPTTKEPHRLEVTISHRDGALLWDRCFDQTKIMKSVFRPVGQKGHGGYWVESSGAVKLFLGVDVKNGGWHWKTQKMKIRGLPVPRWLAPHTTAYKRIEKSPNGTLKYRFYVGFSLPLLGTILSYGGSLDLKN